MERLWRFYTANLRVELLIKPDDDYDLSFDETGEIAQQLKDGELQCFSAHVKVSHLQNGAMLAEESLHGNMYANPIGFIDHRGIKQHENCGSYFSDMVRNACKEARKTLLDMQNITIRH